MEFDWVTFSLEIFNFLVLVWLLQRFLYKPVANVIAQRKAAIDKTLADTRATEVAALSLKQQYENRMADWDEERGRALAQLGKEIEGERARLKDALRASIEREREKESLLEGRRAMDLRHRLEQDALDEGVRFSAALLSRLASAELEDRIRALVIEDLPHLGDARLQSLRAACREEGAKARIASCYEIGETQRASLAQALGRVAGVPVACEFGTDPGLIAGLRIGIGPWVLSCNVRDELKFFAESRHAGT